MSSCHTLQNQLNIKLLKDNAGVFFVILLLSISVILLINLSLYITLAIISMVLLVILACWRIELALAMFVNGIILISTFWNHLEIPKFGYPFAALTIWLGFFLYIVRNGFNIKENLLLRLLLIVPLLLLFSLTYSHDPQTGIERIGYFFLLNITLLGVVFLNGNLNQINRLLWAIFGFGFLMAVIANIDLIFFRDIKEFRYGLLGDNPIWFARSMGLTIITLLALSQKIKNPIYHIFKWFLVIIILYVLIRAGSRGPLVSLIFTLLLYSLFFSSYKRSIIKACFLLFIIISLSLFFLDLSPEQTSQRFSIQSEKRIDHSGLLRLDAYLTAFNLFTSHPLLGVGTGGFAAHHSIVYPHNIILEFASEYGIIGLVLISIIFISTLKLIIILHRRTRGDPKLFTIFSSFALIFFYSLLNAQVSGSIAGNSWIWFSIGGLIALKSNLDMKLKTEG